MHRKFRIKGKVHKKYKPKTIKPDITTQNNSPNYWQNSFDTIFLHHHLALKKDLCITESIQGTSGPGGFVLWYLAIRFNRMVEGMIVNTKHKYEKVLKFIVVFGKLQIFFSCFRQMIEIGYWFQRNPREHPEAQLILLNGIVCSEKVAPKTNIVTSVTFLKFIAMVSTCALFNFKDCCRCQKVIAALI